MIKRSEDFEVMDESYSDSKVRSYMVQKKGKRCQASGCGTGLIGVAKALH